MAAIGMFTSCSPEKDDASYDAINITEQQLSDGFTFKQWDLDAEGNYVAAETGNYISFTAPVMVQIYQIDGDDGEKILINNSNSGYFTISPKRGSDPNQIFYVRYYNLSTGDEVVVEKSATVSVAADLAPEVKLIASDSGVKVWKWNTAAPDGQVWGNLGAADNSFSGKDFALNGTGKWWGVTCENDESGAGAGFMQQLGHTHDGQAHGDESMDATMVISEDGTIKCYDADGKLFREGTYEIKDYDPTYSKNSRYCGILKISAGAILFPYEINSGGNMPTELEIAYLSSSRLVLTYPDGGDWATAQWGEGTFWQFCSTSDGLGCLTDNAQKTWTWNPVGSAGDGDACWGNGAYVDGAGDDFTATNIPSAWWGGNPEVLGTDAQNKHAKNNNDLDNGLRYASYDATMVFTNDGQVMTYDAAGSQITKGKYSIENYTGQRHESTDADHAQPSWHLGTLKFSDGGNILWPYACSDDNPEMPTEYQIMRLTDNELILVYASPGTARWGGCTWWNFKKK